MNIPFIRDFKKLSSKGNYNYYQVTECENNMVKSLDWNLMIVCPLNYTYALLTFGVLFTDDKFKYKQNNGSTQDSQNEASIKTITENKIKSVRKYCEFYTDMSLQSYDCQQYKYSIQALSACIAARKTCGIKPVWNPSFERITGYKYPEIEECYLKLYAKYEKFFCKSKTTTKTKLVKAKSDNSYVPRSTKVSQKVSVEYNTSSSKIREKTISIAGKVRQKITSMKENEPVQNPPLVKHNSSVVNEVSTNFFTNP